jgi:hypothetical protein
MHVQFLYALARLRHSYYSEVFEVFEKWQVNVLQYLYRKMNISPFLSISKAYN